jgi:hypothetical protein
VRKPDSIRAIDRGNEDVACGAPPHDPASPVGAYILAIDRVLAYRKQGKITISDSYNLHDLGKRINEVQLCENEGFLTDNKPLQGFRGQRGEAPLSLNN